MPAQPSLPKSLWTERDFELMGWHDNAVHAVALENTPPWPGRLLLDIDYIVEWVSPKDQGGNFQFWMCPSTLAFEEASDFQCEVDLTGWGFQLSLDEIVRSDPDKHGRHEWQINGHEFGMSVVSRGFTQFLRSGPFLSDLQTLTWTQRGAPSFRLGETA